MDTPTEPGKHTSTNSAALSNKETLTSRLPERKDALKWTGDFIDVKSCERVTSRPWAETYRLEHAQGKAYLKVLNPSLSASITLSDRLARRFPHAVPTIQATDVQQGFILSSDHGGRDYDRQPGERRRSELLSTYAGIQAECADDAELLQNVPCLRIESLVDELIEFLSADDGQPDFAGAKVSARHYLSRSRCRQYTALIRSRAPLLTQYLHHSQALPDTINHGDLRPSNAAESSSGKAILYDWDEAIAGPAGLSLHAMFSGSCKLVEVLQGTSRLINPEELRQPRRELDAYIDALIEGGYASRESLRLGLGAAVVAGMIHYITGFSRFPKDSENYQRTVRRNIKKRMSDLFDVCDLLSLQADGDVKAMADDYARNGSGWRAERLLGLHLECEPMDAAAWMQSGRLLCDRGRLSRAIRMLDRSLMLEPDNAEAHADVGKCHALRGKYIPALKHLNRSLEIRENSSTRERFERVTELHAMSQEADKPGTVPTVYFSATEKASGTFNPETLVLCEALFRKHGVLLMKDVFDPALLGQCHDTFVERYQTYLTDTRHKDALRIGDKRFQITLDMELPYSSPKLYGNDRIVPLMKKLVGGDCILGCFVSVMSLPGSEDQRLHKDHKHLFFDDPDAGSIPSFAVTVMVPLVDLDEHVGTTRIVKGSHRLTTEQSRKLPQQTPFVNVGDCYLMDYRLSHHGQANQSNKPRPIISMLYQRPWFRDYINFRKQPPMRLEQAEYDRIPDKLQPLFRWTTEPR